MDHTAKMLAQLDEAREAVVAGKIRSVFIGGIDYDGRASECWWVIDPVSADMDHALAIAKRMCVDLTDRMGAAGGQHAR